MPLAESPLGQVAGPQAPLAWLELPSTASRLSGSLAICWRLEALHFQPPWAHT